MRHLHALLLFLALAPLAAGPLSWDARERILDAGLGSTELAASYVFTNTSDEAVVILEIKHSCGCTTTSLEKVVYEPGESGSIEVRLSLQGLVGEQVKTVSVYTSAAPETPDILYLYTDVPQRHEVTPAILSWRLRAQPSPRSLQVRFHPDLAFDPADLEVAVEDRDGKGLVFTTSTGPGRAPNEVQVTLLPHSLARLGHAYLTVHWRRDGRLEKIGEAYLIVN